MAPAPPTSSEPLDLSVLGPVRARRGSVDLPLGGRRQRAVLARLALATVAADAERHGFRPDRARALLGRADVLDRRDRPGDRATAARLREEGAVLASSLGLAPPAAGQAS